ncbi:uncharacterized protein LOC132908492 [Bombus pascuorum]|uniref:uncharacterized protein LOC132908492 n=1 Tax=Bombus pascuorum TaxID=65598 RepID=UPI00298E717C|nr:uncharacterized protein LOC132908492 [Bombus pascuorum]XP_060818493.1 uncharacterized protein LOC132908492 [Bombus pascuorum]XP_060818494.1 uncharacterized protein LOC132908492 [Bombus pascuorum]XP_060818495.1 uncharacterized protein LOC132908492 [Bombus pascuorum]
MQELPNEPHEHNTDQANQQPQPQLSTQVDSDSIPVDPVKKEAYDRLEVFVKAFAKEFTNTLSNYENEISVSSKTNETPKKEMEKTSVQLIGQVNQLASYVASSSIRASKYFIKRCHKKKAKRVVDVFEGMGKDELENMLAEAAGKIFYKYQILFIMITDTDGYWTRGMQKVAAEASRRAINHINQYKENNPNMNISVDLITNGAMIGEDIQSFMMKNISKASESLKSGRTIKISDQKCKTSEVYKNRVKTGVDTAGKYYSKKGNGSNSTKSEDTSGLTEILNEDCQEVVEQPEEESILSLEEVKEKVKEILKSIKNECLQTRMMEAIEHVRETVDIIVHRPENSQTKQGIYHKMIHPVAWFTGRDNELHYLHDKLQSEGGKMTAVTGLGGVGKTELVRKYAREYAQHYDNNVIWITSETQHDLAESFTTLADEKLNIQISKNRNGNNQKKQIDHIVEEVYMYFSEMKSLFIFDNAEEYKVIKHFLPTSLPPHAAIPYILITSRNRNWYIGDEGQIHVMPLKVFTQEEATMFIKNSIQIEDGLQEGDIEELTERLQYFPLALRQAVGYINQENEEFNERGSEKFKISDYLKKLDENTMELFNKDNFDISNRYTVAIAKTWVTTLEKIKEDLNHGMKAIDVLNVMAYLAPDQIHASKMFDSGSVKLCYKYSMIDSKKGGVACIHRLVQEVIRLMLKYEEREEKVIKNTLTLIGNNGNISKENISHVTSVWSYASGYSNLIHEFYFNFNSIPTYNYNNTTLLHLLAENGYDKAIKAILDVVKLMKESYSEFSEIIDATDNYNRTPLYMAAENGHASVVKLFVDKEATINIQSTIVYNSLSTKRASAWTPLHVAAFNGYSDIVEILINKDEDLVDIEDSIGRTAAVLAASSGQINVLEILEPKPYDVYLLHAKLRAARKSGNLEDFEKFLESLEERRLRKIVNRKLGEWTPLHLAAFANWLDITKILIQHGAKIEDDKPSFTPLHSASSNGHLDIIKYLIEEKADPKAINDDGWTSLHAAAQNGHLHVVKYFIDERKIDVDIFDNARATPLHTAAFHGKLNVVEFLLTRNANIRAVNIFGATPLFLAAINYNRDVQDFLLRQDVTLVNNSNDQTLIGRLNISLLHVAAAYNDEQMIEDLINKGVDKDIGKDTFLTPLYLATFFDSLEAREYLITRGAATDTSIKISSIKKVLEETIGNSTSESYNMLNYVSTLFNFLPDIEGIAINMLESFIESKRKENPIFGRLIDSLKIFIEERKNPDLDLPLHAVPST